MGKMGTEKISKQVTILGYFGLVFIEMFWFGLGSRRDFLGMLVF